MGGCGEPATMVRLLLTRARWEEERRAWPDVDVEGLEACLALFGADGGARPC